MRETIIMDNLNYKTQAHVRVCKENNLEEIRHLSIKNFVERSTVWYYPRNSKEMDHSMVTCDDTSEH